MHISIARSPLGLGLAAALIALGALSGCSATNANAPAPTISASPSAATWPRAVSVDGQSVTVPAQPRRIVAITSDVADLALQLVGPTRIAAIPATSQSPTMGTAVDLARQVTSTLPTTTDPDPEKVLSYGPDLVISALRHDGEKAANRQIQASGVPVVSFDSDDFNTPQGIAGVITTLGQALGEEVSAHQMSSRLLAAMTTADADRGNSHPTALSLMARGNTVMAEDGGQMLAGLVDRAGATNAGTSAGLTATRPIDAEFIAKTQPQVIFLEDFMGLGAQPFAPLLANPALTSVPAIANHRIYLIAMTQASAISGTQTPVGYRNIIDDLKKVD